MVVRSSSRNPNDAVDPRSVGDGTYSDIGDRMYPTLIRYGESSEWLGPASVWLVQTEAGWELAPTDARRTRDGKPKQGRSFEPLEAVLPRDRSDRRCRFCGHLDHLSPNGYCLGCHRHGMDAAIGCRRVKPGEPEVKPTRYVEEGDLAGGRGVLAKRVAAHKNTRPAAKAS